MFIVIAYRILDRLHAFFI